MSISSPFLIDKSVIGVFFFSVKDHHRVRECCMFVNDEDGEDDESTQPIGKMPTPRGKRKTMTRVVLPQDTAEHEY